LSQDYGNARCTMTKCTHILRTHKLAIHNRAWQQIKQIPHSKQLFNVFTIHSNYCLQSVTPLINELVDDLLVNPLPASAHSVFKIVQVGNWNAIHALLQSSPDSLVTGFKSGLFTREIIRCVRIDRGRPLLTFRSTEPVLSIFRKRSLTELTAYFFCRNSEQIRLAPHPFSCLRTLIKTCFFECERHSS